MSQKKTSKSKSLARQNLLEKLAVVDREVEIDGVKYIVRPRPESLETRRVAALYDKNGNVVDEVMELRRVLKIIDCLHDIEGNKVFSDDDMSLLMSMDSDKLTPYYLAVSGALDEIQEEQGEGNDLAE